MKPKSEPGIVIVSKDFAYWNKIVENLKRDINSEEDSVRYLKACLVMSEGELKNAS